MQKWKNTREHKLYVSVCAFEAIFFNDKNKVLTLNSAIMMSTKLPTTIRASKEFQASIK